jgi:PAS domain S-box-containing protein
MVEDDMVDRMAFLRYVERQALDYQCKTATSVAEGKAMAAEQKFDVVVLDHNLNDGTGFDLLPEFPNTPVIFVTGSESPDVAVQAMKAGACDYLLKDQSRHYLTLMPLAVERAIRQRTDREQLAESQELFRQSFNEAPIGKAFIGSDGRFLRVNRALREMLGYSEEDLLDRGFWLLFQVDPAADSMEKLFPKGIVKTRHHRMEMAGRHKDGHELWMQLDIAQVPDSQGTALTYVAQVQDITARKQAEADVKQAKDYAENIINTAPVIICGLTPDGLTRSVNPAATQILGYDAAEMVGQNWWRLLYPNESYKQAERLLQRLAKGQVINQETTMVAKDGTKRIISWSSMQHCGADGAVVEIIGIGLDVTAQHQAEEVRNRLESQLFQSQKMEALGSLAGGVAHEFNNMLGAIIGYTELAKLDLNDEHPSTPKLDQVLGASLRAKDIIQQILTFSRRQDLKREVLHLPVVVKETVRMIRPTIPPEIEIAVDINAAIPPVFGNPTQVHQALTNLCANARDALADRPNPRISITQKTVHVTRDGPEARLALPDGPYSVLSVTDNGSGMDTATLARVFEPFFTTKAPGKGSGLGMAVVHGIMKSHDGAVAVESTLGKGTCVSLYFPLGQTVAADKAPEEKSMLPHGTGQRVLLVDDEPALSMIGTKVLERLGYKVTAFNAATDAVAAFSRDPSAFDLVITDLTMPGMTGIDFADALLEIRADVPILLATGYIEESIREQASLLGFREILLKPMSSRILAEAAHRALNESPPARSEAG